MTTEYPFHTGACPAAPILSLRIGVRAIRWYLVPRRPGTGPAPAIRFHTSPLPGYLALTLFGRWLLVLSLLPALA